MGNKSPHEFAVSYIKDLNINTKEIDDNIESFHKKKNQLLLCKKL